MPEPIAIVYDGDCAFCRRSLRALQRLDGRGVMHLYESRASELIAAKFPMLAGADFPAEGSVTDHIYLVDPLGNLMMRFPRDPDPSKMLNDLKRLLRLSQIG